VLLLGILGLLSGGLAVREVVGPGPRFGAVINRAEAAILRGDSERAIAATRLLVETRPESAVAWMRAGRALARTDPLAAADHFRRATEIDSTRNRYRWELAKALADAGAPEAWEAVQAVLAHKPDHADALMLAAALTASEGHVEHALGLWIAALENHPSDPDRPRWDPLFDPVRADPRFVEALLALRVPRTFTPAPEVPADPAG